MVEIHANPILATMMQFMPVRYWPILPLVNGDMGGFSNAIDEGNSVPLDTFRALPFPAGRFKATINNDVFNGRLPTIMSRDIPRRHPLKYSLMGVSSWGYRRYFATSAHAQAGRIRIDIGGSNGRRPMVGNVTKRLAFDYSRSAVRLLGERRRIAASTLTQTGRIWANASKLRASHFDLLTDRGVTGPGVLTGTARQFAASIIASRACVRGWS